MTAACLGRYCVSDAPLRPLRGVASSLHVFVSNPRLLFDLQCFLQRLGCATTHVDSHELEVEVPDAPSEEQASREVELYLALWQGRKQFADVEAYISSSDDCRRSRS
jgi:hypothetical protein